MPADVQIRFRADSRKARTEIEQLQGEVRELRQQLGQTQGAATNAATGVDKLGDADAANRGYIGVDVNLSKRSAMIARADSDAPMLDAHILADIGTPTRTVILDVGDDTPLKLEICNGIAFSLECARQRLLSRFIKKGLDSNDASVLVASVRKEMLLMVSKLVVDPKFTFSGERRRKLKNEIWLDAYDTSLLNALFSACDAIINPENDAVYRVHYRRDIPSDLDTAMNACLRKHPKTQKLIETPLSDLKPKQAQNVEKLRNRLRAIALEAMILAPKLTQTDTDTIPLTEAYPLPFIGESPIAALCEGLKQAHTHKKVASWQML